MADGSLLLPHDINISELRRGIELDRPTQPKHTSTIGWLRFTPATQAGTTFSSAPTLHTVTHGDHTARLFLVRRQLEWPRTGASHGGHRRRRPGRWSHPLVRDPGVLPYGKTGQGMNAAGNRCCSSSGCAWDPALPADCPSACHRPKRTRVCNVLVQSLLTLTGWTCQMSRQYSVTARSEEKRPMRATLRIDMRVQCSRSPYWRPTSSWRAA